MWEAGRDVCRDETFAETGRLPGRDVFYPGFKNCLYGKRDGTFFIPALKAGRDDFTLDNLQTQHNIVPYFFCIEHFEIQIWAYIILVHCIVLMVVLIIQKFYIVKVYLSGEIV